MDADTAISSTVAGNGTVGFSGDGGAANSAKLNLPAGVAVDALENVFVANTENHRIRRVDATSSIITTAAGGGNGGDGGAATRAIVVYPQGVATDRLGNLAIADPEEGRIRQVNRASGIITTVAGNGTFSFSGDGAPATQAGFYLPSGVAMDSVDNIFIADTLNYRIRRVDVESGIITTVAGRGPFLPPVDGHVGDGGPATEAAISDPYGVTVDVFANFFIPDFSFARIRRVDGVTGIITTVAGNGTNGFSGDGGPAPLASIAYPTSVALDSLGSLFIVDEGNNRIRRVDFATGIISTVAGNGCSVSVEPGGRCQIPVAFTPRGAGKRTATLTITDDAPDSPQTVALSGTACVGPCYFDPQ